MNSLKKKYLGIYIFMAFIHIKLFFLGKSIWKIDNHFISAHWALPELLRRAAGCKLYHVKLWVNVQYFVKVPFLLNMYRAERIANTLVTTQSLLAGRLIWGTTTLEATFPSIKMMKWIEKYISLRSPRWVKNSLGAILNMSCNKVVLAPVLALCFVYLILHNRNFVRKAILAFNWEITSTFDGTSDRQTSPKRTKSGIKWLLRWIAVTSGIW